MDNNLKEFLCLVKLEGDSTNSEEYLDKYITKLHSFCIKIDNIYAVNGSAVMNSILVKTDCGFVIVIYSKVRFNLDYNTLIATIPITVSAKSALLLCDSIEDSVTVLKGTPELNWKKQSSVPSSSLADFIIMKSLPSEDSAIDSLYLNRLKNILAESLHLRNSDDIQKVIDVIKQ